MNIMKKQYLILFAAAAIFAMGCNRLDVAGMVINRSDTEERVADWLDYNNQNGMPVIENAPGVSHLFLFRLALFRARQHRAAGCERSLVSLYHLRA